MRLGSVLISVMLLACQTNSPWLVQDDRDLSWTGGIYHVERAEWVSEQSMLADLLEVDVVLLGERHDHPDHWRLQHWLTIELADHSSLVFEHFLRSQQAELDQLVKEGLEVAKWGERLNWEKSGWPEWSRFQPTIAFAVERKLPIVASNIGRDEVKQVFADGYQALFSEELLASYQLDQKELAEDSRRHLLSHLEKAHCHPMPEAMQESMLRVQRSRDLAMAEAIAEQAGEGRSVLFFAGSGHVRSDWGVPELLMRLPEAKEWSLRSVAMVQSPDDWESYKAQGLPYDYVWLTPAVDLRDPCEAYREQLEKFRQKKTE